MNNPPKSIAVFVVDDEQPARNRLKELLADCTAQIPVTLVGEAENGHLALEQLSSVHADVVLTDIRMPEMDGIELARHLKKLPDPPAIIFTTAYDNFAVQAFELHAVDYLLKPIRLTRLISSLSRAMSAALPNNATLQELQSEPRRNFSIHERGKIYLIPVEQVIFLRAEQKYVTIRTAEREFLIEESLNALEQEFGAIFVRIHRNCLVAREAISGFEKTGSGDNDTHWEVRLKGIADKLPISRRQQSIIREFS